MRACGAAGWLGSWFALKCLYSKRLGAVVCVGASAGGARAGTGGMAGTGVRVGTGGRAGMGGRAGTVGGSASRPLSVVELPGFPASDSYMNDVSMTQKI